jgi:hypothetical protein
MDTSSGVGGRSIFAAAATHSSPVRTLALAMSPVYRPERAGRPSNRTTPHEVRASATSS